jgi:hypothetical protein
MRLNLTVCTRDLSSEEADAKRQQAKLFVQRLLPESRLQAELDDSLVFVIPASSSNVSLSRIFTAFEEERDRAGITDWGISGTTLEEVFLNVVQGRKHHSE